MTTTSDLRIEFPIERMERLKRADVVAAGVFNGDEIVDIEEENDDFFYDSKSDQLHFVIMKNCLLIIKILTLFLYPIRISFMSFSDFGDSSVCKTISSVFFFYFFF